jgi:ataxin-3
MLQQQTYTELDLAEIARRHVYISYFLRLGLTCSDLMTPKTPLSLVQTRNRTTMTILERALEVWDLALVRWRGEAMKPYQDHPE